MKINPETKKLLIYGGVSIAAGVAVLYLWSKYGSYQDNSNQSQSDATTQANDLAAQQAAQDAQSIADLSFLGAGSPSIGFGGGVSSTSVAPVELPQDNFSEEIASILQAAGVSNPNQPAGSVNTSAPVSATAPVNVTPGAVSAPHIIHQGPVSIAAEAA